MFSGQFYEKWMSVRERNIKLLLETVTYMAIIERATCIITIEIVMCITYCRKYHNKNCHPHVCCKNLYLHKCCRNFYLHDCSRTLLLRNCRKKEKSTNISVESTTSIHNCSRTSKPA